jgi:hypothetical protein
MITKYNKFVNQELQQYLNNHLNRKDVEFEIIKSSSIKEVKEFFKDDEINDINIILLKDEDWIDGKSNPSESIVDKSLILFKKSKFDNQHLYWLVHEISHILHFKKFGNIYSNLEYPKNEVEYFAFYNQFKFMRNYMNLNNLQILNVMKNEYNYRQGTELQYVLDFFEKILSDIDKNIFNDKDF